MCYARETFQERERLANIPKIITDFLCKDFYRYLFRISYYSNDDSKSIYNWIKMNIYVFIFKFINRIREMNRVMI